MPKANQEAIAQRAGLSRATVSRCFTNHPGINPETRAKVFQLATDMGYRHLEPRTGSRVNSRKLRTMGVLACTRLADYERRDFRSPGVEIHSGISEYAQLHKIRLDFRHVNPDDQTLQGPSYQSIPPLHSREWGGALLIYPFPVQVIDELRKLMPVVSLVEPYSSEAVDCVDVDHFNGISSVIDHLHSLGHRRIGFLTHDYPVEACWSFRRYSAFIEKMSRLHLPIDRLDLVNVHPGVFLSPEDASTHLASRFEAGTKAWVCAADHQAYELIASLQKHNISVPENVSITGFDGVSPISELPPLTTVQIPYREIGFNGAKRLHDLARKTFVAPQHILVSCCLREGLTTAQV